MANADLPIDVVKDRLSYDPVSGLLHWRLDRGRSVKAGCLAGCYRKSDGYYSIAFRDYGARVLSHRVAWLLMTGQWPEAEIDHINGNRSDNSWGNLRSATKTENMQNTRKRASSSPKLGVFWVKARQAWVAAIKVDGVKIHLLQTVDFFQACCARKSAEAKYGFHENHGLLSRERY